MGDRTNNKTIIHCCVDKDVHDMLIRHCEATGQTKTTAIKRAIREYCSRGEDDSGRGDTDPKNGNTDA